MSSDMPSSSTSSGFCCYNRRPCSRPRYQKYQYCVHHILEDTSSPFTSCEYKSRTSGRKCPNPASRSHKVNNLHAFCEEHLRELIVKEQHQKQKKKLRKKRKIGKILEENPAAAKRQKLIDRLAKYNKGDNKTSDHETSDSEVEEVHRPITDDWLLDSENVGNNADWDDFDPVNNEVYEPLRYADVLTPEEVVATAQSKHIRLQSLYIEQFKRLFHLLKERRRQYLHDRKKEKLGGQAQDGEDSVDEDEIYALATYRKRSGVEVLLRKRQLQRRPEADESMANFYSKPSVTTSRCSHSTSHTRCKESCLPYTKYCTFHILSDPHQQLYKKCHTNNCPNPVCFLTSRPYENTSKDSEDKSEEVCYCTLHAPLPEMTFKFPEQKKEDLEIDVDVETPEELAKDSFTGESQERCEGESKVDKDASSEVSHTNIEVDNTQPVDKTEGQDDILKRQQDCDTMDVDTSISETSGVAAIREVPAPETVPVASATSVPDQPAKSLSTSVLPSPNDEIANLGGQHLDSGIPSNSEKNLDVLASHPVSSPPTKDHRLEESAAPLNHSENKVAETSYSGCNQTEQLAASDSMAMEVKPLPTPPGDCARVFQLEENDKRLKTTSTCNNQEELTPTDYQIFTPSLPPSLPRPEENRSPQIEVEAAGGDGQTHLGAHPSPDDPLDQSTEHPRSDDPLEKSTEHPRSDDPLEESTEYPRSDDSLDESTEHPRSDGPLEESTEHPRSDDPLEESTEHPRSDGPPEESTEHPRYDDPLVESTEHPRSDESTEHPRSDDPLEESTEHPCSDDPLEESTEHPRSDDPLEESTEHPRSDNPLEESTEHPRSDDPLEESTEHPCSDDTLEESTERPRSDDPLEESTEHPRSDDPLEKSTEHPCSDDPLEESTERKEDEFTLDPGSGVLLGSVQEAVSDSLKANITPVTATPEPNINNNCSGLGDPVQDQSTRIDPVQLCFLGSPATPVYRNHRGDRKPSSVEEELAVVSLLSLSSGHPSDDSTPSSSTDQE